jgi:hypothetical protein
MHYYIVFAFIQDHHDAEVRYRQQRISYVSLPQFATPAALHQALVQKHDLWPGLTAVITGYNEITKEAYEKGLRQEKEEEEVEAAKKRGPPPGDCVFM